MVRSGACSINGLFFHGGRTMTMLVFAVINADIRLIKALLQANADPNFCTQTQDAAVFEAVRVHGHNPLMLRQILWTFSTEASPSLRVNWGIQTSNGMSAIHVADALCMPAARDILVSFGAPSDIRTSAGMTTMQYAVRISTAVRPCPV